MQLPSAHVCLDCSVIEMPLLRIQESDSSDLESVAQCVIPQPICSIEFRF